MRGRTEQKRVLLPMEAEARLRPPKSGPPGVPLVKLTPQCQRVVEARCVLLSTACSESCVGTKAGRSFGFLQTQVREEREDAELYGRGVCFRPLVCRQM